MDDLGAAAMEFFASTSKQVKSTSSKEKQVSVIEEKINPSTKKQLGA